MKEQKAQIDKMVSEQVLNTRFQKLEIEMTMKMKVLEALISTKR